MEGRRNPTAKERETGDALVNWLHEVGAEILSQKNQGRGRWLTIWRTPFGCLLVATVDNRVASVATQVPHGSPGELIEGLQAWAHHEMAHRSTC